MIKIIKKLLILYCFVFATLSVKSTEIKIVYKIDNEIITNIDLKNESNYLKTLNKNLENISEDNLLETATQSLIREKIKKKEIDRVFQINYQEAKNDKNIKNIIKNLYSNLGFNNEEDFLIYLNQNDVNYNDLKNKFVIEQMWNQLIVNKYNNLININEEEINSKVDQYIKNNKEKISFNLSEIVFLEKNKEENKKKFDQIIESIKKIGFEETAILYSISESSKLGGKIGWINENQLSYKISSTLNKIIIGEYSDVINTAGGNIILRLNDKKIENTEINREEEIKKYIRFKKNKLFTEYSIIFFKELENKIYVEKL